VSIAIGVAVLHFVTGPKHSGPCPQFVNGYRIDILLPFSMYLMLGILTHGHPGGHVRAVLVLAVGGVVETLQLLGVPVFGRTFDPLD
jgi:hypothetical protein